MHSYFKSSITTRVDHDYHESNMVNFWNDYYETMNVIEKL